VRVGIGGSTTSTTALPTIPAPGTPEEARLDAARARWAASGIETYRWTYARSCFCPQLTVAVTVEAGEAVDHRVSVVGGGPSGAAGELEILTMLDFYEEVQRAIDTADSLAVAYEPETGRILSLDVDRFENAVDDEYGYAVTSFVPAEARDGASALAELTEQWPCGRGFHLSDPAQTTALMLDLTDPTGLEAPPQATTLPDDRWDARVLVGTDLFANWCDDLIMAGDPVPQTEETWPVVAGTVTFLEDVGSLGGACERPVVARLAGLVVERPDGTHVPIADREVRNSCWNGAAG
jgi:hypothetical protein